MVLNATFNNISVFIRESITSKIVMLFWFYKLVVDWAYKIQMQHFCLKIFKCRISVCYWWRLLLILGAVMVVIVW